MAAGVQAGDTGEHAAAGAGIVVGVAGRVCAGGAARPWAAALVAGEAGVGKSALVEQFQCDLARRALVLGRDGPSPRDRSPLFDLPSGSAGSSWDLCRFPRCSRGACSALLRQISEPGTLDVVVVEDVHWADEATADLAACSSGRLAGRRRRPARRATYRGEDLAVGDSAARLLVSWSGSGRRGVSSFALVRGRGAVPGQCKRVRRGRAVPVDGRKPVLRHRSAPGGDEPGCAAPCWRASPGRAGQSRDVLTPALDRRPQ